MSSPTAISPTSQLVVKNTFFTLVDEVDAPDVRPRRCSSLPPPPSPAGAKGAAAVEFPQTTQQEITVGVCAVQSPVDTQAYLQVQAFPCQQHTFSSFQQEQVPFVQEGIPYGRRHTRKGQMMAPTLQPSRLNGKAQQTQPVQQGQQARGGQREQNQDRRKLNPRAKAWAPTSGTATPVAAMVNSPMGAVPAGFFAPCNEDKCDASAFTAKVKQQISIAVMNIKTMLKINPCVARAEALKGPDFWTIKVRMDDNNYARSQEQVLAHAREAVLQAVQQADGVVLLKRLQPFAPNQYGGFCVMLGGLMDRNYVCWETIDQGRCSRKEQCRLHHPMCRTIINVKLLRVDQED